MFFPKLVEKSQCYLLKVSRLDLPVGEFRQDIHVSRYQRIKNGHFDLFVCSPKEINNRSRASFKRNANKGPRCEGAEPPKQQNEDAVSICFTFSAEHEGPVARGKKVLPAYKIYEFLFVF